MTPGDPRLPPTACQSFADEHEPQRSPGPLRTPQQAAIPIAIPFAGNEAEGSGIEELKKKIASHEPGPVLGLAFGVGDFRRIDVGDADPPATEPERVAVDHAVPAAPAVAQPESRHDHPRPRGRSIRVDLRPLSGDRRPLTGQTSLNHPDGDDPADIHEAVMGKNAAVNLVEGLVIRRSRVMEAFRMEVVRYDPSHLKHLKQLGCTTEIIQWKTRILVPLQASVATPDRLMASYPQAGSEHLSLAA